MVDAVDQFIESVLLNLPEPILVVEDASDPRNRSLRTTGSQEFRESAMILRPHHTRLFRYTEAYFTLAAV